MGNCENYAWLHGHTVEMPCALWPNKFSVDDSQRLATAANKKDKLSISCKLQLFGIYIFQQPAYIYTICPGSSDPT